MLMKEIIFKITNTCHKQKYLFALLKGYSDMHYFVLY